MTPEAKQQLAQAIQSKLARALNDDGEHSIRVPGYDLVEHCWCDGETVVDVSDTESVKFKLVVVPVED